MASTRSPRDAPRAHQGRSVPTREAEEVRRAKQRRRLLWRFGIVCLVLVTIVGAVLLIARDSRPVVSPGPITSPVVGGDLHTLTWLDDALYVGGHAAAAVSRDGGRRWLQVPSLDGADAMGWAQTTDALLVGGHPGLLRSMNGGKTFTSLPFGQGLSDVHALGGSGRTVYLASPQAGVLASVDGGRTWESRNAQAGRSFMGTILVDPQDPTRLIAPDMAAGLTRSTDGGRSWTPVGGPPGSMSATWNPAETDDIVAVGMGGGARSTDGGGTWQPLELPRGVSAVAYDGAGRSLYAGVLDGQRAHLYLSTDKGASWTAVS